MNKNTTDIMIYTPISLSQEQFSEVANRVKSIDGVITFYQSIRSPKLIMVAYNAGKVRALTILSKLTRMGFNASLVGI